MLLLHLLMKYVELTQIMRDPDTGNSRGFGFISYDSFEASDSAIEVSVGTRFIPWLVSSATGGAVDFQKQGCHEWGQRNARF